MKTVLVVSKHDGLEVNAEKTKRSSYHARMFQNCLFPKTVKIKIYKMKLQFCLLLFMFVKPGVFH